MNSALSHIAPEHRLEGVDESFFQSIEVPFSGTKELRWQELTDQLDLDRSASGEIKVIRRPFLKYAVAATVLLLASAAIWASTYTRDIQSGQWPSTYSLPDGSAVALKEETSLSYHPYWWFFKRELSFEGEGYFQVTKGAAFRVISEAGTTEVLGTSFSISTLDNGYSVFCETGRVRVSNGQGSLELTPGELARLNKNGQLGLMRNQYSGGNVLSGNKQFAFDESTIKEVLDELSRHYKVEIELSQAVPDTLSYTGYFTGPGEVEEALEIVSLSLGLSFDKEENGRFKVSR